MFINKIVCEVQYINNLQLIVSKLLKLYLLLIIAIDLLGLNVVISSLSGV